jgi:hypothetical protein
MFRGFLFFPGEEEFHFAVLFSTLELILTRLGWEYYDTSGVVTQSPESMQCCGSRRSGVKLEQTQSAWPRAFRECRKACMDG